ncbi:twin-arginine translocation signal domain-containing protein [Dyadobacter chenwenxiniae]|uniref:Twin-arginine translocation signal domain-containing protein n=1 Tax=Dyadobacter chenwenxiniae TaxID=2906456 RepID=A0A9X1TF82_9BACT|nr:TIM barrel protein [Dyadobacter chenwenxiniae]MCF0062365.1 twin-arginine translocation signal domain-containing protein [Dyadobacter chenwenxiniae]UON83880.1 twin-arginine translocation signal domain-containing protein [Dyadobacter chenwenxiniae]
MAEHEISRRQFLSASALLTAGVGLLPSAGFGFPSYIKNLGKPNSLFNGVQVGAITYSWRSMPGGAEDILKYCIDANISAIELMGPTGEIFAGAPEGPKMPPWTGGKRPELTDEQKAAQAEHLVKMAEWRAKVPMDKFVQLRKMYNDAGVSIYAFKPSALGEKNTDQEVDYAFRAAKALGANQATIEQPNDPAQTKRLGDIAAKNKVYVGYHGHTQQTPTWWDTALNQSKYNAMNFDMGHYVAAGFDPIPLIETKHDHIVSMHVKDRKNKENGGANVVWGQGDTPITAALELMRARKYKFPATIELEYEIPAGSDAVKETAKCVEYARKALGA